MSPPSDPTAELLRALGAGPAVAHGVTPPFAAYIAARWAGQPGAGPLVVVAPDEAAAARLAADIEFFLPAATADDPAAPPPVLHVPAIDTSPYAELSPDRKGLLRRMTALFRLAQPARLTGPVVVASAASLARRVMAKSELDELTDILIAEQEIDRDKTLALLTRAGYARVPVVEDPGTFAVRGGVLDIFPPLYRYPVRIELFGDLVETMRFFEPQTQRTLRPLGELYLHPVRETVRTRGADPRKRILEAADTADHPSASTRRVLETIDAGGEFVGIETLTPAFHTQLLPLASYLPAGPEARWLVLDPDGVRRAVEAERDDAERRYDERLADHRLAFPPDDHYVKPAELAALLELPGHRLVAPALELHDPDGPAPAGVFRFAIDDNRAIRGELERARKQKADELIRPLAAQLGRWREDCWRVAVACSSERRAEQLTGLLAGYQLATSSGRPGDLAGLAATGPTLWPGTLSAGFALPAERFVLLTEDDIFGERAHSTSRQRAAARRAKAALMGGAADFAELKPGDFLVHSTHGVGLYKGLAKLPLRGTPIDFLHLEYDGGLLYLPVYRLGEVQRYVGAEGHEPRLDKLGGVTWEKAKSRATREIKALAEELLQLYAQRQGLPGHAFPPADASFHEFEAMFEFEETPDQQKAIDDVIADMEQARPMDRLVCGDVGYGKTEVALRAALKAVLGGKQVALLAPTTVLVEQHFQTFTRRFGGWPVRVGRLSRFQSRAEHLEVIKGLADGKLDVAVGTHRLLSGDVRFKDLGLIIIDEEQRFGVTHKERLKKVRTQVDVLTLTATPIPRTLHLAMVALRDLSIIATPPADRRAIRTFVARPEDGVLREGITRELARGGQIFFVCPRIGGLEGANAAKADRGDPSIGEWAERLHELVPEAKVAIAHGQLEPEALEQVMVDFVDGKFDILVCTTIIESGLDIPRANTMFVSRADSFGLAQLYQLRGRIGRSRERAFCYLLVPPPEKLTDDAKRRLEALQRFTELGAGFQIASYDLEIRGAGDLLGARQSGAISAVGFETYTSILEEAVAELRGESIRRARDPELNIDLPAYIPDEYVPDTGQRLDLYKRLSSAEDGDEIKLLLDEIGDRYGALPLEVVILGDLMVLKTVARRLGALTVELTATRLSLTLADDTPLKPDRVLTLVNQKKSPWRLTPDMRLQRTLAADEQKEPVAAARKCLLDLAASAT